MSGLTQFIVVRKDLLSGLNWPVGSVIGILFNLKNILRKEQLLLLFSSRMSRCNSCII